MNSATNKISAERTKCCHFNINWSFKAQTEMVI